MFSVRKSPVSGRGAFADTDLAKDELLTVPSQHFRRATRWHRRRYEHTACLRHRGCVLAFTGSSIGCFLNHSTRPNCQLEYSLDRSAVLLRVLRPVKTGSELTIAYGDRYRVGKFRTVQK